MATKRVLRWWSRVYCGRLSAESPTLGSSPSSSPSLESLILPESGICNLKISNMIISKKQKQNRAMEESTSLSCSSSFLTSCSSSSRSPVKNSPRRGLSPEQFENVATSFYAPSSQHQAQVDWLLEFVVGEPPQIVISLNLYRYCCAQTKTNNHHRFAASHTPRLSPLSVCFFPI